MGEAPRGCIRAYLGVGVAHLGDYFGDCSTPRRGTLKKRSKAARAPPIANLGARTGPEPMRQLLKNPFEPSGVAFDPNGDIRDIATGMWNEELLVRHLCARRAPPPFKSASHMMIRHRGGNKFYCTFANRMGEPCQSWIGEYDLMSFYPTSYREISAQFAPGVASWVRGLGSRLTP